MFHVCAWGCCEKAAQTYVRYIFCGDWGNTIQLRPSIYSVRRILPFKCNIGQGMRNDGCLAEVLELLDSALFVMSQRLFDFVSSVGVLDVAFHIEVDLPLSLGKTKIKDLVLTLRGLREMFGRRSYSIRVTLFEICAYILKEIDVVFHRINIWHERCHISGRRY